MSSYKKIIIFFRANIGKSEIATLKGKDAHKLAKKTHLFHT